VVTNAPGEDKIDPIASENSTGLLNRIRSLTANRELFVLGVIIVILLIVIAVLVVGGQSQNEQSDDPKTTPDPSESVTSIDRESFSYLSISESGAISVTLESPIFVDISGEQFSVVAQSFPQSGTWSPSTPNPETVAWAYGSIINYIFGLESSKDNRSLLEELVMGEEIVLTTRSGAQFLFEVNSRQEIESDDQDILAQRMPSVTLILLNTDLDEPRLVVQGQYVVPDTSSGSETGHMVEMGETAQIEGLQLTVTGSSTLYERPEIPTGFAFFVVDFQVQNVGDSAIGFNAINMVLTDEFGNQYAWNPAASQVGNNPPLSGSISTGQSVVASAGYQIPAGLTSPMLRWQVSMTNTGSQIQVNIPFHSHKAVDQQVQVQLQRTSMTPDGTGLLTVGQITNLSNQLLIVDVPDLSLDSDGTIHQMLSTNPGFPWNIPPGQSLIFSVTFQRPVSDEAILKILNQPYQITGLR